MNTHAECAAWDSTVEECPDIASGWLFFTFPAAEPWHWRRRRRG